MMPVNVNAQNIAGSHAAASQIAFGAVVMTAAAGTVKSTLGTMDNIFGVAMNDEVEKTVKVLTEQITIMRDATKIDQITTECDYMEVDIPIMLQDVKALRDYSKVNETV